MKYKAIVYLVECENDPPYKETGRTAPIELLPGDKIQITTKDPDDLWYFSFLQKEA